MRLEIYSFLLALLSGGAAFSQPQYASSVIAYSSQYGTVGYTAEQALGAPNSLNCTDDNRAWASLTDDGQREFLVLGYATPQQVAKIVVYQNYNGGAVDTIYLRDAATGIWHKVAERTAAPLACPPTAQEFNIPLTTYQVDAIRLAINSPAVEDWNEIDAVAINASASLPVRLTSFVAFHQHNNVQLEWSTAHEQDAAFFEIQRSNDKGQFTTIGKVKAAGHSVTQNSYVYTDTNPLSTTNYYRLKSVDVNGSGKYSQVVIVKMNNKTKLDIYPNPAQDVLQLQTSATGKLNVAIYNTAGMLAHKITLTVTSGTTTLPISVNSLGKGLYILQLESANGIEKTNFLKQ